MTAVRWLAAALADVQHITRHISEENPRAAAKVARELLLAGDSLVLFPHRGRLGLAAGTRELTAVWPYIIVYEVNSQAEEVSVLRVWHGAQDR
nr:type II toxin-antitoxin system RelE/ParE family toxin [uncultured Acidocella sp.]